ncbi:hypothetical protein AVEN_258682-1 [Araneus ventricosus]|uniref:Uncharacterized protein n=1 Tax=Araneus ventricosus TaxID=182803 RepID=A0A4Y2KZS6_ARAVE|nr:hypothetical protein AVEN_258682-1 [Araneus ventricosus]
MRGGIFGMLFGLQVRWNFAGNNELHSNTSQREIRVPFCSPRKQTGFGSSRTKNPVHISEPAAPKRSANQSARNYVRALRLQANFGRTIVFDIQMDWVTWD